LYYFCRSCLVEFGFAANMAADSFFRQISNIKQTANIKFKTLKEQKSLNYKS